MPLPADTATWIAVGFAVGAAVLALAATLLLVVVLRRGRAADRPGHAPAEALEDAHDERRRARLLAGIASSIDLDDVLQRILATAVEEAAVDAALLSVQQAEDEPYVATVGMTADEASRQPVATAPPGAARAVHISYRYGPDEERELREAGSELIRGGVAVPVGEAEEAPSGRWPSSGGTRTAAPRRARWRASSCLPPPPRRRSGTPSGSARPARCLTSMR